MTESFAEGFARVVYDAAQLTSSNWARDDAGVRQPWLCDEVVQEAATVSHAKMRDHERDWLVRSVEPFAPDFARLGRELGVAPSLAALMWQLHLHMQRSGTA